MKSSMTVTWPPQTSLWHGIPCETAAIGLKHGSPAEQKESQSLGHPSLLQPGFPEVAQSRANDARPIQTSVCHTGTSEGTCSQGQQERSTSHRRSSQDALLQAVWHRRRVAAGLIHATEGLSAAVPTRVGASPGPCARDLFYRHHEAPGRGQLMLPPGELALISHGPVGLQLSDTCRLTQRVCRAGDSH